MNTEQARRMRNDPGFIAALDQSGGSTPRALKLYGIGEDAYDSEDKMFELVHQMRQRIISSPSFTGEKILASILFEKTMDGQVDGVDTADYLWQRKNIVPILKVDKGLADEANGVKLMKPMPQLDELLDRALAKNIFGTKMRSFIAAANESGIAEVVDQQFEIGTRILEAGLVPIIEPEVDIQAPDKADAEQLMHQHILRHLNALPEGSDVMLKLTIPSQDDLFADLIAHPRVMRVVALSGGYSREESNRLLARNHGLVASFSRALTEGLNINQTEQEFDDYLAMSIDSIYRASIT
ncbi:MAG: fructose bisphosphate aldolase [Brooklawnia sp.]